MKDIVFKFRWPVQQLDERHVVLVCKGNRPIIDLEWAKAQDLTDEEIMKATRVVLMELSKPEIVSEP